jgi:hypothetical protein
MNVSPGIEGNIEQAVAGQLTNHVVQKTVAGIDFVLALTV